MIGQLPRASVTRPPRRALWLLAACAVVVAGVLAAPGSVHRSSGTAAGAPFLADKLGAPSGHAPLARRPTGGISVALGRHGYTVSLGHESVTVASSSAAGTWSRYANGVSRPTSFGNETIAVGPDRTEEFLTVAQRQGAKTWRWHLDTNGVRPRLLRSGAVALSSTSQSLRIAPVRIFDAAGVARTPPGARWSLNRTGAHSWSLELRLDDSTLPVPYVIDPGVDYPSPLYLSSTASAVSGSWRLLTTAPSSANSTTTTTPTSGQTGYFLFKPGTSNTSASTPSGSPQNTGFVQDLAGGTGFAAGTWSFSVETDVAGTALVSGNAVLAIGIWKGTVSGNKLHSTASIMPVTDDPAAQNIRTSLSPVTTTVSYSLPAFSLASTERLYIEVWRHQVTGISSSTAANRQVNLIVNDGISRITHPATDDTAPVNSFQVANTTGGIYFTSPGGATATIFYRGLAAGSFQLQDFATDTGSGVKQVTYPAIATSGWTHSAQTVTTAPNYPSNYSWAAGANTSPGAQAIVAMDNDANVTTGSPITITVDNTAPTTPSVALTSPPAYYATASVALTPTDGTDAGSGIDTTTRVYQRDEVALSNGVCGTFPNTWAAVVANPDTTVQTGKCYRYRLLESDRVGNQSAASAASGTAKVDLQPPTQPILAFSALTNAFASGSTVYYRPGASGNFTVTASSADAASGVAGYVFPTPATWTVTGTGATRTYAWSGTPTPPGTLGVHATDNAGNAGPDAQFTPTADATAPSTTDNTATIGNGWQTTTQTVTLTPSDTGSGVGQTYSTTDGSTPTTSSPSGTTITLASDGVYTIKYFSVDRVGNAEAVKTAPTQIRIDKTPPDTTITAQPPNPSTSTSASFAFTSPDAGASFQCQLDAGGYAACTSPASFTGLALASHTFSVRAVDAAGNVDPTPATYTWTISGSAPDTTITAQPPNPSNNPAPSFSFTSSAPGSTFKCDIDGGGFAPCSSPATLTTLADGSHTFSVQATDAQGTSDPTPATYTWTIDTRPPDTTIDSRPSNPSNDSVPAFTFSGDEVPVTFRCSLDGAPFTSCFSPQAYSALADGPHTFSVQASDAAGNTDPTPPGYTWQIDTSGVVATVDEVHYTFTGPNSVAFDWRGSPTDIRYGPSSAYGSTATAHAPDPLPFSSAGPFREVELTGLAPGTAYHYSIGGGPDHTFSTAPTGDFRFDALGDIGSTLLSSKVATVAAQVAGDNPAFVLMAGDLTYANATGQGPAAVDQHFNDVMTWSQTAAYMPTWGNHEWETPTVDDLRNYKGRFMIPHAQAVPSAPPEGCCGEDWGWFDAGGVRFIAYPEQYHTITASEWQTAADSVFAAAQADPSIHFIVTFGHEPSYSTGFHAPLASLATVLDSFGDRYSKYVLDINGHNHNYERFQPIHGVTHITTGASTNMETPWVTTDSRTAFRAFHTEHLRVDVSSDGLRVDAICGPSSSAEDTTCAQGAVLDSVTIGAAPPPPPSAPVMYVDNANPLCTDTGQGTVDQPFCTIGAAVARVNAGQTVQVASGTYPGSISVPASATAAEPIVITAAPGATVYLNGGTSAFSIANKSYITINGFRISGTSGVGISIQNSSNITISNNDVSNAGQQISGQTKSGIYFNTVRDSAITGNTVHNNSSYGIYLNGSTRDLIQRNEVYGNAQGFARAASGIRLYNSTYNTVDSNRSHNNEDSGIESFTGASNNLIVDNVSYDNGDHGIDNYDAQGQRIFGNTAYHNVTAGINIEGGSTGATIANNISVDNGIASPRTHSDIRVENGSTAGTTLDYDNVFLTTPDTLLIWNSVSYSTLSAFQAASGQEMHGINADPKWTNVGSRDFHLTAGSPAIDSANSGTDGEPLLDSEGNSRIDDPRTANSGAGPQTFYDRGAFEYQTVALDHITVSPASTSIQAGTTKSFTAQGFDASNNSLGDVTASSTFTIAPDGSCTGSVCTATVAGPHTVTATDPSTSGVATATASLLVTAASLHHLVLTPATSTTVAGAARAYTVDGRDQYDNSIGDVTGATTFTISPNGTCSGNSCSATTSGPHTVTGTDAGKTGTASLQVVASTLDHIVISPLSFSITAGGSATFTAQGFDSAGNSVGDVTPGTTFSIAPDGSCIANACTATAAGTHTVTANNGGKTSTATLMVNPGALDHLAVSPATASISAGGTQAFTAQGRDSYDNSLGNLTGATSFTIAPNGSCTGANCSTIVAGPHTVTATDGSATGTASLQVAPAAIDHLALSPATASIPVGDSQTYAVEGFDVHGNSTGDETLAASFTIAPDGSCGDATCNVSTTGPHTVTATVGAATGTASLQVVPIDHIVITPDSPSIVAGGTQAFTAEGFDGNGDSLGDVTSTTTFSIAPDGSCTGNVCTATPAWPHTVTAVASGLNASTSLFVTPAALDHLVVTADSSTVAAGTAESFAADGRDQYDNSIGDVTSGATFTIAPNGTCSGSSCTATVAGPHTVTASYLGKTGSFNLTVTAGTLDHLVLSPASATAGIGAPATYTADGRDAYGNSLGDVTSSTLFTIAPDGSCNLNACSGAAAGVHTVTGSLAGASGTASLNVTGTVIDHIVISPASTSITAGGSASFTTEAFDASNNDLGDVTGSTIFTIAPNGSCTGNSCTATTSGAHTVTATAAGKSTTAAVTVNAGPLDHLALSPATATISSGGSQAYTADGRDQYDNSLGDVTATTTFTIAPNGSCAGATCTAASAGAHTVTGTKSGKTGTATLTVTAAALDHIVISPASATITAGGSQAYTAQGFDAASNSLGDVTGATTFTISPNGSCTGNFCTATLAGAHTVTGTDSGKTSTASLTVNAGTLDHLALAPASATIATGGSQAYTADGRDQFNNSLGDVTATTTFTIAPNGSCTGATCTASAAGAHTVTGTKSGKTGTATLTVGTGTLDHIVISPGTATIAAGGSQAFTVQAFDAANNSLGDVTGAASFSILPDGSCSANVCTATVAGNHTVTATYGGKTSSASVTVNPATLDHLTLTPASASITAGGSQSYTAQARDAYGNLIGDATSNTTFTISPNGSCFGSVCTASVAGAHTVVGTFVGATGSASLLVNAGALDHIVISPSSSTVPAGTPQAYTAQGFDALNNSLGNVTSSTTFTISPDGSCSGSSCTPAAGGTHTVTGADAGKTSVATLNADFVKNGGFETDLSGWNTSGSGTGVTLARVAGGRSGSWAAKLANTSAANQSCVLNDTPDTLKPTVAGSYTGTMWVRGDSAGAPLKLRFREYAANGNTLLGTATSQATLTTSWQQVSVAYTVTSPGSSLDFNAYLSSADAPPGTCFSVDDASVLRSIPVDHITISPASSSIAAGSSQSYTAQGFDGANNSLGDVTSSTTFSIAPDGSCTGNVCTAAVAGPHTVTGNDGGKTSTASLTVTAGPIDHLVLSPASTTITAGGSQAYTAQGFDSANNSLGDVTATTTFTIAPDGSCTGATCTTTSAGPHTVTGTKNGKTGTATLTVNAAALDHLGLSPASATITAGGSQAYTATGFDQYNNPLGNVTGATTFSISPDGSCTAATCTASVAGAHTVTGSDAGKTGTATLTVGAGSLHHIVISPASATIVAGSSQAYTAQGFDSANNSLGDVTGATTFTIAPDGSCTGATCTATTAGAHTVTGTDAGKTSTATLTVNAGSLHHLALSPSSASIASGGSQSYTADGRDQYGNSLGDITASTTFTIAPNGSCTANVCTATSAGAHTVTGTSVGATGTATLTVGAGSLDHIVISPASSSIPAGDSQTYTAQGFDAANNSLGDVTGLTTFTIAPNGSCTGATCTATALGPHTVTGTDAGKTSTASLAVVAGQLDHLVLSPSSATIDSGGTQAYTAQGFDSVGDPLGDVTASTTFMISPDGSCTGNTCTATTAGAHTVTGTDGTATGTATLTVNAAGADHIAISPATATIAAGGSKSFTVRTVDASGNPVADVTASSTFSISPDGSCSSNSCTATAGGAHTVTATYNSQTATASLTVTAAALDSLVIAPASATITIGSSQVYTAQGFDTYGNSLGDVTSTTTFTIAPNGSCTGATCSANVAGAHTVTGTNAGKTSTASLTVTAGSLDHIVISPASGSIVAGTSQAYTAQGFDAANNSIGDVTASTTFSIAPDGSCTGASCSATVASAHTVTGNNSGKTSTAALTVTPASLDHLALSPASATITAGGSQAYTAQGRDQYNNSLGDVTSSTTFTISPNGSCTAAVCTATTAGAHTVTGTSLGATGTASLQVNPGSLDHLTLSPATAQIPSGGSQSYSATGFDQYSNSLGEITAGTTFTIAPDGSCTGSSCTASFGGSHTVTGTSAGKSSTAALSVSFVKNSGFETDTSNWNVSGSGTGVTLTRVAGGHSGGFAAQLTNTSTSNQSCVLNDSPDSVKPTVAGTYTGTIWVRADRSGAPLKLRIREYTTSGTLINSAQSQITLSTGWQQVTVTYTVSAPSGSLDFNAFLSSADAPPGTCFYADDAALYIG